MLVVGGSSQMLTPLDVYEKVSVEHPKSENQKLLTLQPVDPATGPIKFSSTHMDGPQQSKCHVASCIDWKIGTSFGEGERRVNLGLDTCEREREHALAFQHESSAARKVHERNCCEGVLTWMVFLSLSMTIKANTKIMKE